MDVHADDATGLEIRVHGFLRQHHVLPGDLPRVHEAATALGALRHGQHAPRLPQPIPGI